MSSFAPMQMLVELWHSHTVRAVAGGSAVLGAVGGALGAFAVLRRQSLVGDAISHAALPGVALAFLLTGAKGPLSLAIGAAIAGLLGMLLVMAIIRTTRIKEDGALGIVLSVFFGFGLVMLELVQRTGNAAQAGLDRFLFGQAAAMLDEDVRTLLLAGVVVLAVVALGWKEFKILCFDPAFAASLGFPVRRLEIMLTGLLTVSIVLGLQTVGVVLMSAVVVAPAAAARQWTDRLGRMVILAAIFGAVAGAAGAVFSARIERLPTGPTIVLCATSILLVSLVAAPERGMAAAWFRRRRNAHRLRLEAVLSDLYELELQHGGAPHGHEAAALGVMSLGLGGVSESLARLESEGLVHRLPPLESPDRFLGAPRRPTPRWALTLDGFEKAAHLSTSHGFIGATPRETPRAQVAPR